MKSEEDFSINTCACHKRSIIFKIVVLPGIKALKPQSVRFIVMFILYLCVQYQRILTTDEVVFLFGLNVPISPLVDAKHHKMQPVFGYKQCGNYSRREIST